MSVPDKIRSPYVIAVGIFLYILPTTLAGLAIDQHIDHYEAVGGDECNYNAFIAFRLPILEIIVKTWGHYGEQNIKIANYESFRYTNYADNKTTEYDYVPIEFESVICKSRIDPLMCELTNYTSGMGVCVCLKLNVTDDKGKFLAVRTFPFKFTEFAKRKDLVFSDSDEDNFENETNTNTSITQAYTTTTLDPNENLPYDITKCYAHFGTFCGSPYINCKPYRGKGGRTSTDCTLSICGTSPLNSANLHLVLTLIFYFFVNYAIHL